MQPSPSPAISVRGLRKNYRDVVAVDGLSFDPWHGEILGILGPNGSGKTTTLKSNQGLAVFRMFERKAKRPNKMGQY